MRCLERNKVDFYYALYAGKQPFVDEYGNETGEYLVRYHEPVLCKGNISQTQGEAQTEIFGISIKYDKVIILDDKSCPIKEDSILFIDAKPTLSKDKQYNNDYVVKAKAVSLNSVSIAIRKVGSEDEDKN